MRSWPESGHPEKGNGPGISVQCIQPVGPRLFERRDAGETRQEIDAQRRHAELNDGVRIRQVCCGKPQISPCEKLPDRREEMLCRMRGRIVIDVDVLGGPGARMEGDCVGAGDQVLTPFAFNDSMNSS